MGKINTSGWKEFHLYDVFDISMGNKMDRSKMSDGDIAFIGRTANNNGINARVGMVVNHEKYGSVKPYSGNCLTLALGGSIGSCFYQEEPFYTSQNVVVLIPRDKQSKESLIFAATAISYCVNNGKYGAFSEELNKHIKTDFVFNLPATPDGHPDWNYMEQFMFNVMADTKKKCEALAKVAKPQTKVAAKLWEKFPLSELFDVVLSSDDLQPKHLSEGSIPLVSAGTANNGVAAYVNEQKARLFPSNSITVDMFGNTFYQADPFYAVSHGRVNVLIPKTAMDKLDCLFIQAVLNNVLPKKYSYESMCTSSKLALEQILLPVTESGKPDWAWMRERERDRS